MKIVSFQADNLFAFDNFESGEFYEVNLFVGPNNSGKTSFFRTLRILRDLTTQRGLNLDMDECVNKSGSKPGFEAFFKIRFDRNEISLLERFIEFSTRTRTRLESGNLLNSNHEVSRFFGESRLSAEQISVVLNKYFILVVELANDIAKHLASLISEGVVVMQFEGAIRVAPSLQYQFDLDSGMAKTVRQGSTVVEASTTGWNSLVAKLVLFLAQRYKKQYFDFSGLINMPQDAFNATHWKLFSASEFFEEALKVGGLGQISAESNQVTSSENAELAAMLRNIGEEPTGISYGIGWLLFKIIGNSLIFTDELRSRPVGNLQQQNLGLRDRAILAVDDLAIQLHALRNGSVSDQYKYENIRTAFHGLFPNLNFTVEERRVPQEDRTNALIMVENVDLQQHIPLEYTGSGLLETLYLLVHVLGFTESVLLLDEPAAHLHPTKQKALLTMIEAEARKNQSFIITHSPYLIKSSNLERTFAFRLERNSTHLYRATFKDEKRVEYIRKWVDIDPNLAAALFANKVILVDGSEEERALPIWLRKAGVDLGEQNIFILNTNGDAFINTYKEILDLWQIPMFLFCDGKARKNYHLDFAFRYDLPEDDFGAFLEAKFPESYGKFRGTYGGSKPVIASFIALEHEPPNEIHQLADQLRKFIEWVPASDTTRPTSVAA